MVHRFVPLAACLLLTATVTAQETEFSLPANPAQWINSPPVSMEAIRGKGVVLYFFEEG